MGKEGKFWFCTVSTVVIAFITMIMFYTYQEYKTERTYIENGYEQVNVVGSYNFRWQKAENCND